jgi:hypothetical protein
MSEDDENRLVEGAGAIPALAKLLTSPAARVQAAAASALRELIQARVAAVVAAGVAPKLVALLGSPSTELRDAVAGALFDMSREDDGCDAIAASASTPELLAMLTSPPRHALMATASACVLRHLCSMHRVRVCWRGSAAAWSAVVA